MTKEKTMNCPKCGTEANGAFCGKCGWKNPGAQSIQEQAHQQAHQQFRQQQPPQPTVVVQPQGGIRCPHCGSTNVNVQVASDVSSKKRGFIATCLWILLAVCTLFLIVIIPMIMKKGTKTTFRKFAVCNSCGHSWNIR